MKFNTAMCFDDFLLVPQYSEVASRLDVDLSVEIPNLKKLKIPIMNSPMDSIVSTEMLDYIHSIGGLAVTPRSWIKDLNKYLKCISPKTEIIVSIGLNEDDFNFTYSHLKNDPRFLGYLIDTAHGDSKRMLECISRIKQLGVFVIAGNIATVEGAIRLNQKGADCIRVGIGGGSVCTTRIVTGHGIPTMQSLLDISEFMPEIVTIADGGIRNSGDGAKALAAGASLLMLGGVLAGTDFCNQNYFRGNKFLYNGQASKGYTGLPRNGITPEGTEILIPYQGSTATRIDEFLGGLRSALSYSGAYNIKEFKEKYILRVVSTNSIEESKPHGRKRNVTNE